VLGRLDGCHTSSVLRPSNAGSWPAEGLPKEISGTARTWLSCSHDWSNGAAGARSAAWRGSWWSSTRQASARAGTCRSYICRAA